MENNKKRRYSFSRLSTFSELCERRYAFEVTEPRTPSTKEQARGSHVHECLEQAAHLYLTTKDWDKAILGAADVPGILDRPTRVRYLNQARHILEEVEPVEIEKWFDEIHWPLEDSPPEGTPRRLPVVGKIDLVFKWGDSGKSGLLDWKTIRDRSKIKYKWEAKRSLQLQIYALATAVLHAGFGYLMQTRHDSVFVEFEPEVLAETYLWIHKTIAIIEGRWKSGMESFSLAARGNALCCARWCQFWNKCLGAK